MHGSASSRSSTRSSARASSRWRRSKASVSCRSTVSAVRPRGAMARSKIRALVAKLRYEIEAEGARQMNEAQNVLSPAARASNARLRLIEKLDAIIRESVKPMEKIEGIRILQVDGLGGAPSRGDGAI